MEAGQPADKVTDTERKEKNKVLTYNIQLSHKLLSGCCIFHSPVQRHSRKTIGRKKTSSRLVVLNPRLFSGTYFLDTCPSSLSIFIRVLSFNTRRGKGRFTVLSPCLSLRDALAALATLGRVGFCQNLPQNRRSPNLSDKNLVLLDRR